MDHVGKLWSQMYFSKIISLLSGYLSLWKQHKDLHYKYYTLKRTCVTCKQYVSLYLKNIFINLHIPPNIPSLTLVFPTLKWMSTLHHCVICNLNRFKSLLTNFLMYLYDGQRCVLPLIADGWTCIQLTSIPPDYPIHVHT